MTATVAKTEAEKYYRKFGGYPLQVGDDWIVIDCTTTTGIRQSVRFSGTTIESIKPAPGTRSHAAANDNLKNGCAASHARESVHAGSGRWASRRPGEMDNVNRHYSGARAFPGCVHCFACRHLRQTGADAYQGRHQRVHDHAAWHGRRGRATRQKLSAPSPTRPGPWAP